MAFKYLDSPIEIDNSPEEQFIIPFGIENEYVKKKKKKEYVFTQREKCYRSLLEQFPIYLYFSLVLKFASKMSYKVPMLGGGA